MAPTLLEEIALTDFDLDRFVRLVLKDSPARDEIVGQMIRHPDIMVYYHCFYILEKASQKQPALFYPYWDSIADLLNHPNSYHRDFALTILAQLTTVDCDDRFNPIFAAYFEHLHDDKFMTACCCVKNTARILRSKPDKKDDILAYLLNIDALCSYPEKQKALLKSYVLEALDEAHDIIRYDQRVIEFVLQQMNSISPKTRRIAKILQMNTIRRSYVPND